MIYFKYELKLELIPYFVEEIHDYLGRLQTEFFYLSPHQKGKIKKLMTNKVTQIQNFYHNNYLDFRAHMVLKSHQCISQFLQKHSAEFPVDTEQIDMKQKANEMRKLASKDVEAHKGNDASSHSSSKVLRGLVSNFNFSLEKAKDSDVCNSSVQSKTYLKNRQSQGLITSSCKLLKSPQQKQNINSQSPKVGTAGKKNGREVKRKLNQHEYVQYLKSKKREA